MVRRVHWLALACGLLTACVGPPPAPSPGRSAVWGYLRLVPHAGAHGSPVAGGGSPYGDRRYASATLVDYSRPGFAVVYLEGPAPAPAPLHLAITAGLGGVRITPAVAAMAADGRVELSNDTPDDRVVSCPETGLLERVAPGATVTLTPPHAGALAIFLPGIPDAEARVFASPGPFAAVDADGRYELGDVPPGPHRLQAWHPRFPPVSRPVALGPGVATRVDLEMGVGLAAGGRGDAG